MKPGDLVKEKETVHSRAKSCGKCRAECQRGIVIRVDTLLRHGRRESPVNEIVILLSNGRLLYSDPLRWEQDFEV